MVPSVFKAPPSEAVVPLVTSRFHPAGTLGITSVALSSATKVTESAVYAPGVIRPRFLSSPYQGSWRFPSN